MNEEKKVTRNGQHKRKSAPKGEEKMRHIRELAPWQIRRNVSENLGEGVGTDIKERTISVGAELGKAAMVRDLHL